MKIQSSVEEELADWLEDGPTVAPGRVLETVVAALPAIPQRRRLIRLPQLRWLPRPPLAIAAAFAAIVIAVGALVVLHGQESAIHIGDGPPPGDSAGPAAGFSQVTYQLAPVGSRTPDPAALATTSSILTARARLAGITGVTVTTRSPDEVVVTMPTTELTSSQAILGATGLVQFIPLPPARYGDVSTGPGGPTGVSPGQPLPADAALVPLFDGSAITSASAAMDQNGLPVVDFQLSSAAASAFTSYTTNNIGNFFAIVVDGVVIEAPSINSPISGGRGEITVGAGTSAQGEVNGLVVALNSGALPFPIRSIQVVSGGPSSPGSSGP